MNRLTQSKNTTILPVLIALTLGCFGLSPQARAVCQDACLTNFNTVLGEDALLNNTGLDNTAIGFNALYSNTVGNGNTAIGNQALYSNTTGYYNIANGAFALTANTIGGFNTASGAGALVQNTTGNSNTASGYNVLSSNTTGGFNTATGESALSDNTTGGSNSGIGHEALFHNTVGSQNTATGEGALYKNKTGSFNTAVGTDALRHNPSGGNNIALGFQAGFDLTGSHNIDIGNKGAADDAGTIRIGTTGRQMNAYVAGISGATVPTGVAVIVDSGGHLGTATSSARFKDDIRPMDKASEAILALKPVTFRYKHELDPDAIPQFGLVAEEVGKVDPDLVARDGQGKPYTVRYEAVNAMLLNEFLKEHKRNEKQEATIAELKSQVQVLTATLKEQAAQIQKVSAQVAATEPAARLVTNQ